MKKLLLSAVAVCSLFSLLGCHNRAELQTLQSTQAAELEPMQQSYKGLLPCADCEGIETSLFLEKDGTWVMNQRYQGAKPPFVLASYGSWVRTADKLVLTESNGEKLYFRPKTDGLEMLAHDGSPIHSQFNYTLKRVNIGLPTTPSAMKGMYNSDATVFQDCVTGKTYSIANNAELERGYAAVRRKGSPLVLLEMEAHFTQQVSPNGDEQQRTLEVDKVVQFTPGKDCADL